MNGDNNQYRSEINEEYSNSFDNDNINNIPDLLNIPHRQEQIIQLTSFLDLYNLPQTMPSVQFINGPKSSGVNYVMRQVLQHYSQTGYEYIVVKKGSVIDHKSLMREIGRKLYTLFAKKYPEDEMNDSEDLSYEKSSEEMSALAFAKIKNIKSGLDSRAIETFSSFKDYLQNLLLYYDINIDSPTSIYIFLQEFDDYPLLDFNTIFRFSKISESLHGSKFQIKFIFSFKENNVMQQYIGGMVNPVITQFPRYTSLEIESILASNLCKEFLNIDEVFGRQFINICCESFSQTLGFDLMQLSKIIKYKYKEYEEEIVLCKYNFAKFLSNNKHILQNVEVKTVKKRKYLNVTEDVDDEDKKQKEDKYINFSRMTKYILISCYYCSYYPSKCDSLFFLKSINEKLLPKSKSSRSSLSNYELSTEPRGFALERLLLVFNIFFYQDNEDLSNSTMRNDLGTDVNFANCFTQLLDIKYVGKNINDYFDCYRTDCKYKLLLPPAEIKKIAESVGFERTELVI
ncbi:hypothetical protein ACO0SA_002544 [Hanseniaspora valbyensis]